ncbi:MAG: class I SAM-dependent methyltransferase [Gammaproteobacteria bacterium]|nr:class I SAM-dependent methyltransferase [Gammaproteobacteria bacterium]
MNIESVNREAWNKATAERCPWVRPVSKETIDRARAGDWAVTLAGPRTVPGHWFGEVENCVILCLGSGGGQQAAVLAAAGAEVTSLDLSDEQVRRDQEMSDEHALGINCVQGTMTDLSRFEDSSFDVVFNPVSITYIDDAHSLWHECHRVLKSKGRLMVGTINPYSFLFEENEGDSDKGLIAKHSLPFIEEEVLSADEVRLAIARNMMFCRSHTLEDIIGGQARAGFAITDLIESRRTDARAPSINRLCPTYLATLAVKV